MKKIIIFISTILLLSTTLLFAASEKPKAYGIGLVANNLMEPMSVVSDFVQTGCFVIGGSFLFASLIKYIEHRRSPLMVPISTVVFLLIAGIALILLPFLSFFAEGDMVYSLFK